MSLITDDPDESPRDCSRKRHHHGCGGRRRRVVIAASSTAASLLALAIILWLTLRPSNPSFSLLAATATAAGNGSSAIVVDAALSAHNPNAHAAALYDRLRATAAYAGVPLTAGEQPPPPLDQPAAAGQGDALVSLLLTSRGDGGGGDVAAPAVGARALLRVRVEGQLRWKVAAWVSGRHGLTVDCVAAVPLQAPPSSGVAPRVAAVGAEQGSQCATHVQ
ncbi:hypothetical protein ACP4OV_021751 [Aristida adscensionis]